MEEITKMLEGISKAWAFVNATKEAVISMDESTFLSTICMLLEEYAKANDTDATYYADCIRDCVHQVNEEFGKY